MSVGFIDAPPDLRPDAKKNTTEVYPNGETLHRGGYPWLQRLRDDTVAGGESSLTATADMSHPPTLLNLAKTGDLFRTTCSTNGCNWPGRRLRKVEPRSCSAAMCRRMKKASFFR